MSEEQPKLILPKYPWHERILSQVSQQIAQNKLHHGLLIKSRVGFDDEVLAKRLAKRLLCDSHTECDCCQHCRFFNSQSHPNIIALGTNQEKIGIEDIRKIEASAYQTATFNKPKVFIIHHINQLSKGAQNALLKILEEPPTHTNFILTSNKLSTILATIISRVQKILYPENQSKLEQISHQWIVNHLQEMSEKQQQQLLKLPLSGPLDFISVSKDPQKMQSLILEKQQFAKFMAAKINATSFTKLIDDKSVEPQLHRLQIYVEKTIKAIYNKLHSDKSDSQRQPKHKLKLSNNWQENAKWQGLSLTDCYQLYDSLVYLQRLSFTNVNIKLQTEVTLSNWQQTKYYGKSY